MMLHIGVSLMSLQTAVTVSLTAVAYPESCTAGGEGVQQILLRTEGRENGDLGAVVP
jgi:hypothetical protein